MIASSAPSTPGDGSSYGYAVTLRLQLPHRAGELARVTTAIASAGGLIGDIVTERITPDRSVRRVTIEARDEAHGGAVMALVRSLDGVEVLEVVDPVIAWHRGGKIRVIARRPLETVQDLAAAYTPGVARICSAIEADPEAAWALTGVARTVGVFTNGTRVLGLGNIGPLASLPVMEGKSLIYAQMSGLSAIPMLVDEPTVEGFVRVVESVSAGFGAIHLEDIRGPDCFEIERLLIKRLAKPVFHDDQHGTATAAMAAVLSACARQEIDLQGVVFGQIGLGAAGSAIARLARSFGISRILVSDPDATAVAAARAWGAEPADLASVMKEAQIVVAATGRGGLIPHALVKRGQIVLALSNPEPEITPDAALAAGAAIACDGQVVNNALAYPGIVRGLLDARARHVTTGVLVAAATAIASCTKPGELMPSTLDPRVHAAVALAVRQAAKPGTIALRPGWRTKIR